MVSKDDWLDAGLAALAASGEPSVRTDRLATALGVSKGSFHHHFAGASDYRAQLLARYEALAVRALRASERTSADDPLAELGALAATAPSAFDPNLERAVRAWAFHDAAAREAQGRVDAARLERLEAIWRAALPDDPAQARAAALLPHLVVVGAGVAVPPPSPDDLQAVFDLLVRLAPGVGRVD